MVVVIFSKNSAQYLEGGEVVNVEGANLFGAENVLHEVFFFFNYYFFILRISLLLF